MLDPEELASVNQPIGQFKVCFRRLGSSGWVIMGNHLVPGVKIQGNEQFSVRADKGLKGGGRGQVSTLHIVIIFSILSTCRLKRQSVLISFKNRE